MKPLMMVEENVRDKQTNGLQRRAFLGLWLLALLPHLVFVLLFIKYPIALDDMFQYDMLARSLVSGNGYRWYAAEDMEALRPYMSQFLDLSKLNPPPEGVLTAFRAPGYPFFLAVFYGLFPLEIRFAVVRVVQAALMALMAPLVAQLALRLGLGRRAAIIAGVVVAFYPILCFYPIALASENLFIPLVLISFLLVLRAADSPQLRFSLFAGLALGLAILTRSILLPFAVLAALWLWRFGQTRSKGAFLLLATVFGVCLPWAIRNTLVMGRPVFVENSGGYNLFVGYHPEGNGGFVSDVAIIPLTYLDDAERDQFCTQAALEYIRNDPAEAALRVLRRAAYFVGVEDRELAFFYSNNFFGEWKQPWLTFIYLLLIIPWIGTCVFSFLGMSMAPKRAAVWLALALVVGYASPHFFIMSEPRFHLALVPILLPFAAWGWLERRRVVAHVLLKTGQSRYAWAALSGLILLLSLWIWGFAMNWTKLLILLGPEGNLSRFSY